MLNFFFRVTEQRSIISIQRYILHIVECRENTCITEFCDTRHEKKALTALIGLQCQKKVGPVWFELLQISRACLNKRLRGHHIRQLK